MEIREKDHKKANALIEIVEICMWWKDFKQVNIIHVNGNRQSHSTGKGYLCKSVIICTKKKMQTLLVEHINSEKDLSIWHANLEIWKIILK